MVPSWIAAIVALALVASQATARPPRALVLDRESSIASLELPPVSVSRVKHASRDTRADARRPSPRLHAIVPTYITLEADDARIAVVSTTLTTTSPEARSTHRARSRAPPPA